MGADQSNTAHAQLKSQRDEDIPYTSYSISKPIDGVRNNNEEEDTPRSSPRLTSKTKSHHHLREGATKEVVGAAKHDIVVVKEGSIQPDVDPALAKLESIPVFLPIMKGTLNLPNIQEAAALFPDGILQFLKEPDVLEKLDSRQVLQLCARYQEHLKQCAEAVAFDQNALCVRIKEVDFHVHTIYTHLTERQKRFAKYAEQVQKIQEMHSVLNRVKMNVEQTTSLLERLNSVLPPDEQLEPFVMQGGKSIN